MINELRFHDIGVERQADIMEATFPSRQKWILKSRPTFSDVCGRFPPLNELHLAVSRNVVLFTVKILINLNLFKSFLYLLLELSGQFLKPKICQKMII